VAIYWMSDSRATHWDVTLLSSTGSHSRVSISEITAITSFSLPGTSSSGVQGQVRRREVLHRTTAPEYVLRRGDLVVAMTSNRKSARSAAIFQRTMYISTTSGLASSSDVR